jgi:hypothetical protein
MFSLDQFALIACPFSRVAAKLAKDGAMQRSMLPSDAIALVCLEFARE